ncbi:MAG: hypothetical protein ABIG95_03530 [Candidatus Woesearchaeota archaeon]
MNKKHVFAILTIVSIVVLALFVNASQKQFKTKRDGLLSELSKAVEEAEAQGNYHCCIEPPCTMCYLGNWEWEDGICLCDEMIAEGKWEEVCPQCKGASDTCDLIPEAV